MERQKEILARTLYGEARGEGPEGMQAVANVIVNRARLGGWWGDSIETVCKKRFQFSLWNDLSDPNTVKTLQATPADPAYAQALDIAGRAIDGTLPDITGGATHYHADWVNPEWANPQYMTAQIGKHSFYEGIA